MKAKNEVRVYACGGGGINIVYPLDTEQDHGVGFAKMQTAYVDTSDSNLKTKNIDDKKVYLYDGIDGSGKHRAMNYDDVAKNVKAVLLNHKPSVFNIVVHTTSGGSGSVIGPVLVSELKQRGAYTIVILVGSTDTRIEVDNTIKTLKSYESISKKTSTPVVVHYIENSSSKLRKEVDMKAQRSISQLLGLLSGQNAELDTADLQNWLDHQKVTGVSNTLVHLDFATTPEELLAVSAPVSVASLAVPGADTRVVPTPAYQCVGYVPNEWRSDVPGGIRVIGDHPIHYCISDDHIYHTFDRLTKRLKEIDDVLFSKVKKTSFLSKEDSATSEGIIL